MPQFKHAWVINSRVSGVLGALGTLTAIVLFLSPIPMYQKIRRANDTLGFSGTPYLVAGVQCFAWILYCALTPGRAAPLATNAIGIAFESVYSGLYLFYARDRVRRSYSRLCGISVVGCIALVVLVFAGLPAAQRASFVGYTAIVLNIASYSSPLGVMGTVVKTRSVACMPLPLSVATLACALAWSVFAIYVADATILVPNIIGVALAATQVILFAKYASTPESKADRAASAAQGGAARGSTTFDDGKHLLAADGEAGVDGDSRGATASSTDGHAALT